LFVHFNPAELTKVDEIRLPFVSRY